MASRWVDRDGSNKIVTVYSSEQAGLEKLDDTHPDIVAFFTVTPPTPAERIASITGDDDLQIVTFKMIFKLHNRLLIQEGKTEITVDDFLIFLEGELT